MPTPETNPEAAAPEASAAPAAPPDPQAAPANGAEAAEAKDKEAEDKEARAKGKEVKEKEAKKKFASKKGVETMFRTSYRTNMDLSALADAKANIMISINGLIVSILLASLSPGIEKNVWLRWPTVILLVGCLTSLVFAVLAARPRVQRHHVTLDEVRAGAANLLFFGNFTYLSRDEFMEGMNELMLDTSSVYENMVMDLYGLGQVLQKKYRLLRVAYTVFMIGLVVGVLAFIIVYIFIAPGVGALDATTTIPIVPAPSGGGALPQ